MKRDLWTLIVSLWFATALGAELTPQERRMEFEQLLVKAKGGDAESQTQVGTRFANGEGVELDLGQAVRWYRTAAEKDHHRAQILLGSCYLAGQGVPRDMVEGYAWWSLAEDMLAGLGLSLKELEKQMTRGQVAQALERKRVLKELIVGGFTGTPPK